MVERLKASTSIIQIKVQIIMHLVSPENEQLDNHWMAMFKDMNFELGIMELYAISDALAIYRVT